MSRLILLMAVILALTTGAVCGSSEQLTDEEFRAVAQVAAEEANLTRADFPTGWTAGPRDSDDDREDDIPDPHSPECVQLLDELKALGEELGATEAAEGPEIQAMSDQFSAPESGEVVSTEVEVIRALDVAAQTQAEELFDEALERCVGEAILTSGTDQEFNVTNLSSEFTRRELGDWARDLVVAYTSELAVTGLQFDVTVTITMLRSGRTFGTFTHVRFQPGDSTFADSLRSTFAARLAQADAGLPE